MGVYSMEAAERLAAKNNINSTEETFMAYENSLLEFGIQAMRTDMAIFESMIELDFKEYYNTLNEADDDKKDAPSPVTVNNVTNNAAPQTPTKGEEKKSEYEADKAIKADKEAERNKKIEGMKSNAKSKMNELKAKANGANIATNLKRLWDNLVEAIRRMLAKFKAGTAYAGKNGDEKLQKQIAALGNLGEGKLENFKGKMKMLDVSKVDAGYRKIIAAVPTDMGTVTDINSYNEGVKAEIADVRKEASSEIEGGAAIFAKAKGILLAYDAVKAEAEKEIQTITQKVTALGNDANRAIETNKVEGGNADEDSKLQHNREVATKLASVISGITNAYLGDLSQAATDAKAAISKLAGFCGADIGNMEAKKASDEEAYAAGDAEKKAKAAEADNAKSGRISKMQDANRRNEEIVDSMNDSADMLTNDDLLTESEIREALATIYEDAALISVNECYVF